MLSKKSCFNAPLCVHTLRRFFPIWGGASLVMLFAPFFLLMRLQELQRHPDLGFTSLSEQMARTLMNALEIMAPACTAIYALFPAMALLSYLYQSRSVLGMHALPVHRGALFMTYYVTGLAMMILPLLVFVVTTLPLLLWFGAYTPFVLSQFCLIVMGQYFFFFSFALFCGMLTGQLWGLPLFYGIFNGIVALTFYMTDALASHFLFGYATSQDLMNITEWGTPLLKLYTELTYRADGAQHTEIVAVYAMFGLAYAFLSLLLFRSRHLERAGEIVSARFLRPIFLICMGVYGGFCLMMLIAVLFSITTIAWMFGFMLLGSLLGVGIGQMLLEKTVAVFHLRTLKSALCICGGTALLFFTLQADLLGYQTYVAPSDEIVSASIDVPLYVDGLTFYAHGNLEITDPDQIAQIQQVHQTIIAAYLASGKSANEYDIYDTITTTPLTAIPETTVVQVEDIPQKTPNDTPITVELHDETSTEAHDNTQTDTDAFTLNDSYTCYISIVYNLKSGKVISRSYLVRFSAQEVQKEGTPAYALEEFANQFDLIGLLTAERETFSVCLVDENDQSMSAQVGSNLATSAIDVVIAELEDTQAKPSTIQKRYDVPSNTELNFWSAGNLNGSHFSGWSIYINPRPDSATEAFVMEKMS